MTLVKLNSCKGFIASLKSYIQKLIVCSKTFQFAHAGMAGQSYDRMISSNKNRRTAAYVSYRLKENLFKQ